VEVSAGQMLGVLSTSDLYNINVIGYPFPEFRFSPYFLIGTGSINTRIRSTLVEKTDSNDLTSSWALGVRAYLTRSFFLRLEYKELIIYSSEDDNEELEIWSVGVGSFF
ncbi:MAG: porin family protein, partial [Gammaproteobacteria bacterium]|nr:porin family protein [Gammaproteobacteria bacterium]